MKMIKLFDDHYIVVDDIGIDHNLDLKKDDWCYRDTNIVLQVTQELLDYYSSIKSTSKHNAYKITHSTQPIEECKSVSYGGDGTIRKKIYDKIKELPLQEVKELIGEDVDVWNRKLEYLKKVDENTKRKSQDERIWIFGASDLGFTAGYKQALEDNKERKYTEKDIRNVIMQIRTQLVKHNYNHYSINYDSIIQSLQMEWDVEFSNGKLKLKK